MAVPRPAPSYTWSDSGISGRGKGYDPTVVCGVRAFRGAQLNGMAVGCRVACGRRGSGSAPVVASLVPAWCRRARDRRARPNYAPLALRQVPAMPGGRCGHEARGPRRSAWPSVIPARAIGSGSARGGVEDRVSTGTGARGGQPLIYQRESVIAGERPCRIHLEYTGSDLRCHRRSWRGRRRRRDFRCMRRSPGTCLHEVDTLTSVAYKGASSWVGARGPTPPSPPQARRPRRAADDPSPPISAALVYGPARAVGRGRPRSLEGYGAGSRNGP